jgi:hypothetical protein
VRAQNLSICVPYRGCDKDCAYCVSKMTGYSETDRQRMRENLPKVLSVASMADVSSVLLTGKGEPCLNMQDVVWLLDAFDHLPAELQTNGLRLLEHFERDPACGDLERLRRHHLNVLAFSLDGFSQFQQMAKLFAHARALGLVVRVTFNLTDQIDDEVNFDGFIGACRKTGVDQFSLRQVSVPNEVALLEPKAAAAADWIRQHVDPARYQRLVAELLARKPRLVRKLPYGAAVYDVDGIAVSYFDYCIQDDHRSDDMRSLIFNEDGHVYTAWNSPASILF